jgi:hypothetical protein
MGGIPKEFIDQKKEELRLKKVNDWALPWKQ